MHVSSQIVHGHCLILSACRRRITRILNLACNDLALLDWLLEVRFFSLSRLNLHDSLRTFVPIATAHLYCARYSLVTRVPRHFQARAPIRKLNKTTERMTFALT